MTEENEAPESDEDHRDRRIRWTIFAVGVVAFIGIMVLGRPLVEARLEAARNLDTATSMIEGTNDDLAALDTMVRAEVSSHSTYPSARARTAISELRKTLGQAITLSRSGYERLTTDEQKRALVVEAMAFARLDLLEAASNVVFDPSSPTTPAALEAYDRAAEKVRAADAELVKL